MSILKALPSRRNPQAIQQYLLQEKKLRNSFISGSQVRARNFGKQFDQVQQLYGKTTGRRYYHYILSFSPEETQQLSPREVNQMGVELAEEFFGKKATSSPSSLTPIRITCTTTSSSTPSIWRAAKSCTHPGRI